MNPAPPTSSHWKAILLLVVIFILGAACGIGGGLFVLRRAVQQAIARPGMPDSPVDLVVARIEASIVRDLDLTDAERTAIHPEFEKSAAEFKALRVEIWQKAAQNIQQSLDRLSQHLPPEKQKRLRQQTTERLGPWGFSFDKP